MLIMHKRIDDAKIRRGVRMNARILVNTGTTTICSNAEPPQVSIGLKSSQAFCGHKNQSHSTRDS